ncbi:DinB family protein [Tellurirhabdus bombi]|uniref:DinB family protein n=1 Tax=Tellurirhabdus bombi TaxID=2907205 RepID=UPI001F2DCB5B|nr:DinB family protein [Tellurirhabdus bombi]
MKKPQIGEYPELKYFANYIEKVDDENVIDCLSQQKKQVENLYKKLSSAELIFRYAEKKWSPKQILGHMTDTERIFAYRAMCIARGEKVPLPGFDENDYVDGANFDELSLESLLEHYHHVRSATIALGRSLTEEAQLRVGSANGHPVSARAMFSIIAGHERHHLDILAERYGFH